MAKVHFRIIKSGPVTGNQTQGGYDFIRHLAVPALELIQRFSSFTKMRFGERVSFLLLSTSKICLNGSLTFWERERSL